MICQRGKEMNHRKYLVKTREGRKKEERKKEEVQQVENSYKHSRH